MAEATGNCIARRFDLSVETKARKLAAVRSLARNQHGVVTRDQALASGFSVSSIARAVERREWQRLYPGIFIVDPAVDPVRARMMGAVLRAAGRTWISHRSAAALWGIEIPTPLWPDVTTTANLRGGRATVRCVSSMSPADTSTRFGIPVTSPERTLVDLGAVLSTARLENVVVDALQKGLAERPRLLDRARDLAAHGRPGSGAIERILHRWDGGARPESVLEAKMLRVIRRNPTLPEPVRQWEVRDRGRLVARVDFAYPEQMIAIEADGYRWHSDVAAWQRDLERRNTLTRLGWTMLNFTWDDVHRRPRHVAETICAAISRRSVPENGTKRRENPAT